MLNWCIPKPVCGSTTISNAAAPGLGSSNTSGNKVSHCEQRLKDARDREDAPPRNVWMAFRDAERAFASDEKSRQENAEKIMAEKDPRVANFEEWKILKEFQQHERQEFFAEGKSAFSDLRSSIYGEVREEFRDRWADYYAERKAGGDAEQLDAMKAQLIADQREVLETRRDEACSELREFAQWAL